MWHPKILAIVASFAALAAAEPAEPERHVTLHKRGELLTEDDLVLAETHGVNTTEMFKHSTIKRRGEEDITIWVHHDFKEAEGLKMDSSHKARAVDVVDPHWRAINWVSQAGCNNQYYVGDTGPNAPCTGGLMEIANWADRNSGVFDFHHLAGNDWRTLVAAGSNSDCNGRFRARKHWPHGAVEHWYGFTNVDISRKVKYTVAAYAHTYNGRERARSHGQELCGTFGSRMDWQIQRWPHRV